MWAQFSPILRRHLGDVIVIVRRLVGIVLLVEVGPVQLGGAGKIQLGGAGKSWEEPFSWEQPEKVGGGRAQLCAILGGDFGELILIIRLLVERVLFVVVWVGHVRLGGAVFFV